MLKSISAFHVHIRTHDKYRMCVHTQMHTQTRHMCTHMKMYTRVTIKTNKHENKFSFSKT